MKISNSQKKTSPQNLLINLKKALLILKMERSSGRLAQTHQIKKIKKQIAQILTEQNQKSKSTKANIVKKEKEKVIDTEVEEF